MAKIGMREPRYRVMNITADAQGKEVITYGEKKVMGKAISANVAVNVTEAKLYADDTLAESVKEFIDGTLTVNTDDLEDTVEADLLGATVGENGEIINKGDDSAPWVELGYILARMKSGKKQYRGVLYTKVQFAIPSENNQTKGQTIAFDTPSMTGTLTTDADGVWRRKSKWLDTPTAAQEWLDTAMT